MIIGNLKRWYRGVHHAFRLKNTGFYCNEFTYRFNQCNLEFEPEILKRIGNLNIPFTMSCYELEEEEFEATFGIPEYKVVETDTPLDSYAK